MGLDQIAGLGVVLGVITTALALVVFVGRPLRRLARQNDEFREDWYGSPARPGRPAVPGIPERLARLEQATNGRDTATVAAVAALRDDLGRRHEDLGRRLLLAETRIDDHLRTHHATEVTHG